MPIVHSHILSSQKKALLIIASVLFIVFAVVGYTLYANNASASTLAQKEAPAPSTADENETSTRQEDLTVKQYYLQDIQSEVKEIQREAKNALNTATINELISKFSSCLTTLQSRIGSPDYWNASQDCDAVSNDIQTDLENNLRPARDCHKNKRNIQDRKKEKKNNIDSQIKNILKNDKNADMSELTAIVAQMDEQFAKAAAVTGCTSADNDILKDVPGELDYIFRDFYNIADEIGGKAEVIQELEKNQKDFNNFKKKCNKQLKREFNDYEKEIGALQKKTPLTADQQAAHESVKSLYADLCTTILADMEKALAARDHETFQSLRRDFSSKETDLQNETNELQQSVQEEEQKEESLKNVTRDLQQKKRDLTRMQKELKRTNKLFNRAAKKHLDKAERKEALAIFVGYVAQAGDLVARIETGLAAAQEEAKDDPDAYWDDRSDELNDLQNEFNDLQSNIGNIATSLQMIKEVERGLKSAQKDLVKIRRESNGDPELMKSLESLLSQAKERLQQAWVSLATDPEEAIETLQDIQQLENDWQTTLQDWRESKYDYVDEE